jgi:hypothetical protein
MNKKFEITLNKGREYYIFRYDFGDEEIIKQSIYELAESQKTRFDKVDAMIISNQISEMSF